MKGLKPTETCYPEPMVYQCPVCQSALRDASGHVFCAQGHHFDRARSGYLNLHAVQHKNSRSPGDSATSISARRSFFDAGYYRALQYAIGEFFSTQDSTPELGRVLDLGCGEGYYAGYLAERLPQSQIWGLDISKAAIQAAAKRYRKVQFAVGSSYKPPYQTASFSHLLSVFAPLEAVEARRLLRRGGSLLRVLPARAHLYEIKALLYPQAHYHEEPTPLPDDWRLKGSQRLQEDFEIKSVEHLQALISMTPYAWRLERMTQAQLCEALPLKIGLDVYLEHWQPQNESSSTQSLP